MQILTALYDSFGIATQIVRDLESADVARSAISIIANTGGDQRIAASEPSDMTGATTGASAGAVLAGGAGLLAGLGMIAIPGMGPLVAAGWLASTAAGAAAGGVAGGLLGALVEGGVGSEDAPVFAESVRRGATFVSVRAGEDQVPLVRAILYREGHVDPVARGAEYRALGWTGFEDGGAPYPAAAPAGSLKNWPETLV